MIRTRVLLADDHAVVVNGLQRILDRPGFEVVGAVSDGRALVEAEAALMPDLVITDISMPLLNGIESLRQILRHNPKARVIFLSMHPEAIYAVEAMNAGAKGYVVKNAAAGELMTAIRMVLAGEVYVTPELEGPVMNGLQARRPGDQASENALTDRQREVLQLLAEGKSAKEIAALLNISDRTVEFHKYRIMDTLGIRTVAGLAAYAVKSRITG